MPDAPRAACHPDLEARALPPDRQQHLRQMLQLGPWAWPGGGVPLARARAAIQAAAPPAPRPGQMVLVSCDPHRHVGTAWVADLNPARLPQRQATFVGTATTAWSRACVELPQSLPFLWSPLYTLSQRLPVAWPLGSLHRTGDLSQEQFALEGSSFGLSFALMLASELLGQPLPQDLAASTALRVRHGHLAPVEGLDLKLWALTRLTPGVRRLLIYHRQAAQAQRLAQQQASRCQDRAPIEIIAVQDLPQALALAFPRLREQLDSALHNAHSLEEVTQSLFQMSLGGRHQTWRWRPVQHTAEHLLTHHADRLNEVQRHRLGFARAVASRHEGQPTQTPPPHESWLSELPPPLRLRVLAHSLQQAVSVPMEAPQVMIQQALSMLPPLRDSFPDHLRMRGALARLYAVRGQLRTAMQMQAEVARAWLDHLTPSELSFGLCQWFHLAAALGDRAQFLEAQELNRTFRALDGLRDYNHPYVDLSHARGLHLLGEDEQARHLLRPWLAAESLPQQLQWQIWRHWGALHTSPTPQEEALRQASQRGAALAHTLCLLLDLERAQGAADHSALLAQLRQASPEPTQQLLAHFAQARHQAPAQLPTLAAYLTRCFPL